MMKIFGSAVWPLAVSALLLASCAQSPTSLQSAKAMLPPAKELPVPPEFQDQVAKEFTLGAELKTYDDVAWIGTDAIEAVGFKPKPGHKGGFVVEPLEQDPNGVYQLSFINEIDGKPKVVAFAQVRHDSGMGHVLGAKLVDPPAEPSFVALDLYRALVTAKAASGLMLCQATYNSVVVPYTGDGILDYRVYLFMSTKLNGEVPIGGHVLIRVGSDTKTVLEVRPLAKSCMTGEQVNDPKVVSIEFSDLALDSPSAAQVFLMWRYGKPIYMSTKNGLLWGIEPKGISLLDEGNAALDKLRVHNDSIPMWLTISRDGKDEHKSQEGCTEDGQCDIDPALLSPGAAMLMVAHRPAPPAATAAGVAAADLRTQAIALAPEVPGAGDWGPLASHMVGAVLTPNSAHYVIEGSPNEPKLRYLGGGDEKLAKYVLAHWHKGMTDDDIVHMLEAYLSQGAQP